MSILLSLPFLEMSDPSDQCAVDANGHLKPATKIDFYFDKDDDVPMSGPGAAGQSDGSSALFFLF